jgi:hypothetical protein
METVSVIEIVATIIGTMGGWEAIKYLLNRKTNKRKEEAEADGVEFGVLRDSMEFLQNQLKEKEERFVNQTDRLRKLQDDYFELLKEKQSIELELQRFRCVRPKCAQREPQNGY